jgi:hypothetical protein
MKTIPCLEFSSQFMECTMTEILQLKWGRAEHVKSFLHSVREMLQRIMIYLTYIQIY